MVMGGVGMPLIPGKALAITTRTALSHSIIEYNRGYSTRGFALKNSKMLQIIRIHDNVDEK